MPRHAPDEPETTSTGQSLFQLALHHKRLVVLGAAAGLLCGALYYLSAAKIYQSTAQLWVIERRTEPATGNEPRAASQGDVLAPHLNLLSSPLLIERAIRHGHLNELAS